MKRSALLSCIAVCFAAAVAPSARGAVREGVPVLMYHRVDASVPPDAVGRDLTVEPRSFEDQLRFLRERHIATLTAAQLTAAVARGDHPVHAVVLTFDDGYEDNATVALPILRRYGARATFYVSSGFIGTAGHVSWRQLRAMRSAGMEVACHGTFHLDLSTLDRSGQLREAGGCMQRFARYLGGSPPATYAYPAGKYDDVTFGVMRALGIRAAFTERPGSVTGFARPFELPRRRVRHDDDAVSFAAVATP